MTTYTKEQAHELILLAITVWREARGEGLQGMRAVAWSIRNRVLKPGKTWWGDDWEEVVLKKWQYEANLVDRPNLLPGDPKADQSWAFALQAAEEAYWAADIALNPIGGATHYYAFKTMPPPNWVTGAQFICELGGHRFYIAN